MVISGSAKHQPEFDLDAARQTYVASGPHEALSGEQITSPYDLYSVETLRDRKNLRIGCPVPTDVFVFGKGEPEWRACTKVGGLPYWPRDRAWPADGRGRPLRFLAQFCFADSTDLFSDELPGTVLLLFVGSGDDWKYKPNQVHFEWVSRPARLISRLSASRVAIAAGPFYGVIHRSADYPDAADRAYRLKVSQSYNLPVLNGTKIGGLPHYIQGGIEPDDDFLCQLTSIQAKPSVPYPWVNDPQSLQIDSSEQGVYGKQNCVVIMDMGTIYIFRDSQGHMNSWPESY